MSTPNFATETRTSMSEPAFELIQCFYDGVDVLVRELAEEIARDRGSFLDDDKTVIAIEVEDVKEAGNRVIQALSKLVKDKSVPSELQSSIQSMQACFNDHAS